MGVAPRFGFEFGKLKMDVIPFLAKQRQALSIAQGIPKDYFLYALILQLRYRNAVSAGTTNGTVLAHAPENLIEQIEISGNHKIFGDLVRTRLQGDHIYWLGNMRGGYLHERTQSIAAAQPVDLNRWSTAAPTDAVANNDFSVTYLYHLAPPRIRAEEQLVYLLDPPLWNSLNLFVDWGDATSYAQGGDRTHTLSAFGSGAGNPSLTVWRVIVKLKGDRFKLNPIPLKETFLSIKAETSQTDQLVTPLNVGNFVRSVSLMTGTRASAGSIAKTGDAMLSMQGAGALIPSLNFGANSATAFYSRIKIKKDDILIRDVDFVPKQEWRGDGYDMGAFQMPAGWQIIDFAEGADSGWDNPSSTVFDTRQIALQNLKFTLEGDITGAVDQRIHVIHTEFAGVPVFA